MILVRWHLIVAVSVSPKTYNFLGLCFTIDINNQDRGGDEGGRGEDTGEIDKSSAENIIRYKQPRQAGTHKLGIIQLSLSSCYCCLKVIEENWFK